MAQRRATRTRLPTPAEDTMPADGKVTFPDGDWVQFPTEPSHAQARAVTKAVLAARNADLAEMQDCEAPTIAALAFVGWL